jgi:5S rRNA maturation endonuclease (ribonuclease M5)/archaellum biogenesis ATPase FlaH
MPFWKLARHLEIEYDGIDEINDNFTDFLNNLIEDNTKSRPLVLRKQVEAFTNFLLERQLKPETVAECGGYYVSDETHQDYGYLVFEYGVDKYGKTKSVRRRIVGIGDRFRNSGSTGDGDSKALFGRDFLSFDTVILVEGITDYLTLWQESYRNIVASFGAKLSKQQAYLLENKTVFILFDVDYDGASGALRAKEILKEWGCNVHILKIPKQFSNVQYGNKIDVNSAYCTDRDGFLNWLELAISKYSIYDSDYVSNTFLATAQKEFRRLRTQIDGLDALLLGGFPVGLHGIAGKEKAGKSSVLIYLAIQAAIQGMKTLLVSYELTKEQMWARIASYFDPEHQWAEIEENHLILPEFVQNTLRAISEKIRVERDWSIDEIKTSSKNFDVIGIDYIQRMPYDGNDERTGIKKNTYALGDLAYSGNGKIIILNSSMPETNSGITFKETNAIKYAIRTGYILTKVQSNLVSLDVILNTGGIADKKIWLEMDYTHQKIKETVPPELTNFIKE